MDDTLSAENIALVFTDIVNSTWLRENHPTLFREAKSRHDALIRRTLADWNGEEINTTGDGFFLAFRSALDTAQWAKAAQILLMQQTWQPDAPIHVRIGLHFGKPRQIVHPSGRRDYEDSAVNFAQRIMGEAEGGEIFASKEFYEQVCGELTFPFEFRDRGWRNLRGIGERRVWQLVHRDLPAPTISPPPDIREIPRHNIRHTPHAHFYGRENALGELRRKLQRSSGHPVALVGMGGIGKTQMAAEYAHAHLTIESYPDGVFWLDTRSDEHLLADYAEIGEKFFGLDVSQGRERVAERVCRELQQLRRPALIIFDNVTEQTDLELLPSSRNLHLLFTTQRQILPVNWAKLELPPLDEEDALKLLQVYRTAHNAAEWDAAVCIARSVGNLPLALALASHDMHVRGRSFVRYWQGLSVNPHETLQRARDHFITATGHIGSVYDTIDLAVRGSNASGETGQQLSANALKVLAAAACFASNGIPQEMLRKATGISRENDFEEAMISLWNRSLLKREEDERQSIHELIRIYALTNLLPRRCNVLLPRVLSALTDHLYQANQTTDLAGVRNDITHCYAAVEIANGCRVPPVGLEELLWEMTLFLATQREDAAILTYAAQGVTLTKTREGEGSTACAKFLRVMGEAQQEIGDTKEALHCVRRAWCVARKRLPKDAAEMADYCNSLGYVLKMQACPKRALPFYLRALAIHEAQHDRREIAVLLNNIGALYEALGELPAALDHLERALNVQAALGENLYLVIYLNNTGRVKCKIGCCEDALLLHERARRIAEAEQGSRHPDTGSCHYYLAESLRGLGRRDEALTHYRQAKRIYERTNDARQFDSRIQTIRTRIGSLEAGEN